jgi:alpha-N-arabinofuranosidase
MKTKSFWYLFVITFLTSAHLNAQNTTLTLDLTKPGKDVSPNLYGLMTEEINYSYDGGLYGELIKNRIFKNNAHKPDGWSLIKDENTKASIQLIGADEENVQRGETGNAINTALTTCLKLTVDKPGARAGIANEGYWGIPVRPGTTYTASFYIKGTGSAPATSFNQNAQNSPATPIIANNTAGPITVSIESNDGKIVYASGTIDLIKSQFWKKYSLKLKTAAGIKPTKDAHFVISTDRAGLYYFNLVSLFPPTYNNRANGDRQDITQLMVDMKPAFLRFPGGNFLEGPYLGDHFPWKTTLGPLEERPGHNGSWGYRATDGMGLLEFLGWCEDVHMEPLPAVFAGYSLRGDHIDAGPLLAPYVQDALNELEYITGDVHTYWGAKRAADGHPAPFKISYVEIGNEDWFDRSNTYDARFNQFRKAINTKYPKLHCISTIADAQYPKMMVTTGPKPYMVDEHYYQNAWQMEEDAHKYDSYNRKTSPKIFVGEWATREGSPTTNLNAALGDAAWMTGMERNSDLVLQSCYAPLFVNVNPKNQVTGDPGGMQWASDLIGYNALESYGSPSYYVQKMFNNNIGNKIVPVSVAGLPMIHVDTTANEGHTQQRRPGRKEKPERPSLYYVATRNTKTGIVYLKVVNVAATSQEVTLNLKGGGLVASAGTLIELKGSKPEDTNTIEDPKNIIPVTRSINGLGQVFKKTFEPYSVSILKIQLLAKK